MCISCYAKTPSLPLVQPDTVPAVIIDVKPEIDPTLNPTAPKGTTTSRVAHFIRDQWGTIVVHVIAWGAIVGFMGMMYGYKQTSVPMSIGIGCGTGFGMLTAVLTVTVFDRNNEKAGVNTFFGLITTGLDQLDANWTKMFVVSLSVNVLISASVVFPLFMGVIYGTVAGNLVLTLAVFYDPQPLSEDRKLEEIENKIDALEQQMDELARNAHSKQPQKLGQSMLAASQTLPKKLDPNVLLSERLRLLEQQVQTLQIQSPMGSSPQLHVLASPIPHQPETPARLP